MYKKANISFSF